MILDKKIEVVNAQDDAIAIYFVILAAGHNRASYFVHLLEKIFYYKEYGIKT